MSFYHLQLPDRSEYNECFFDKNLDALSFIGKLEKYKNNIRILCDKQNLDYVQEVLSTNKMLFNLRNTTWFRLKIKDIQDFFDKNFDQIGSSGIVVKKVSDVKQKEFKELENFMINSFGVDFKNSVEGRVVSEPNDVKTKKIIDNLPLSLLSELNTIYLVYCEDKVVGTFTLVNMKENLEVQLHSVAARSALQNRYEGKDRLSILLGEAIRKVSIEFSSYENLTFSSSKPSVVEKYIQAGFMAYFDRVCIELVTT